MEAHIERCRSCYVVWETAAQHVHDQVPEDRTKVRSLLDSMENCHVGKVVARIAHICDERNGMMDNFENAVAYLLPICPVKEKTRRARKRPQISSLVEDIQGGLNEDSHDDNVVSAKISLGEEASCEE